MKFIFFILIVSTLTACSKHEDWICKSKLNTNGKPIQYSENIDTGEIGGADKCQNK
ncbi:hypothetical protein AS4_28610 [Acinetobacter guillouiae]|nr:hypothetical protein AS4_28610 [Acinetobacter guillouiae]